MSDRKRYTGGRRKVGGRQRFLGGREKQDTRERYTGAKATEAPTKHKRGFLENAARYSGAELLGNIEKDIGQTALGIGPGLYHAGKAVTVDTKHVAQHPLRHSSIYRSLKGEKAPKSEIEKKVVAPTVEQYKQTYGPLRRGHVGEFAKGVYEHPVGPALDLLTVADLGATGAARLGLGSTERATLTTRSPRNIATGKGPVHKELTSAKPLVRGREKLIHKARPVERRVGGSEVKQYGKQIQREAGQHALEKLRPYESHVKATRRLNEDEWAAVHIRARDIHPEDLAELWRGTPAGELAASPKVQQLVLKPTQKILRAEAEGRRISAAGEKILRDKKLLREDTANARAGLTKRQATQMLGRPVREIHGQPYYVPDVMEPQRVVSPIAATGGGKGIPKLPGTTKQNTGALALSGKLHLRGDVLGPEFLRRVKYVKYDEVHNALVRGAIRVTRQEIEQNYGGKLPNGYEYIRTKPGQKIPAMIRGEGEQHIPIDKLIPDPEDLHESVLAKEGFSTTDPGQAHTSGGRYYIIPKQTVKAATGEFTRSSDFTRNFVKRPLSVWRAVVLGTRVGFLTNNLIGNSVMYAAKTGGNGALRDLFGAIMESHGPQVARKALDNPATPPKLRADLYREYFPEQFHGTFGRSQSPATSTVHVAGRKATEVGRAVTGAIPKLTSAVAETSYRKALVRQYIRNSPEFRQVYKRMPKQTRNFETAARKVLEGKVGKQYQRAISKQVNQALGDYLNLSATERNVVRNALPFYSWYKAITTTTMHLAADTPLRANILGQLGQIGKQHSEQDLGEVPTFLEGAIPAGGGEGGTKRVVATQGLNPYATLEQLRRGATEDVTDIGLNPFLIAAAQTFAQAQHGQVSPAQLATGALGTMIRGLPPSRLIAPLPPSKLYPNRGRKSEGFGWLGVPVKEYNPAVARQQARQGR